MTKINRLDSINSSLITFTETQTDRQTGRQPQCRSHPGAARPLAVVDFNVINIEKTLPLNITIYRIKPVLNSVHSNF
jgi:hypothetical protein